MKLSIYSLKGVIFQREVDLLNCKTEEGEITILNHHQPYITILSEGIMKIIENKSGKEFFFKIKSGFLEVKSNNEARCLVEE